MAPRTWGWGERPGPVYALSRYVGWDWEVVGNDDGRIELGAGGVLEELAEGGGHGEFRLRGVWRVRRASTSAVSEGSLFPSRMRWWHGIAGRVWPAPGEVRRIAVLSW
jgi:hypothetical protein